jgi:hypothetical protein
MARRLSLERQRELDDLRAIFEVFGAFEDDIAPVAGRSWAGIVSAAHERGDLAGMRMIRNDSIESLVAFSAAQRRELDRRLRAGPGITLDSLEAQHLARIDRIRAKGRIATEPQYYLVKERIEVIWDDPERAEEYQALRAVLQEYEERVAQRVRRAQQSE